MSSAFSLGMLMAVSVMKSELSRAENLHPPESKRKSPHLPPLVPFLALGGKPQSKGESRPRPSASGVSAVWKPSIPPRYWEGKKQCLVTLITQLRPSLAGAPSLDRPIPAAYGRDAMGEKIPAADRVQHLTDWGKLESMLAAARGRPAPAKNAASESRPPERSSPTLEDLGKAVDLEKLRKMFDERGKQPIAVQSEPKPAVQPVPHQPPHAPTQSTQPARPASAKTDHAPAATPPSPRPPSFDRRNADMSRWSLNAVAYSAAEFLAGSKSPEAGFAVLAGAVTASVALLKKYGQSAASESLASAARYVSSASGHKENPASFRAALEELSPQAKALFSEMDKVQSRAPKGFSPKDPASVQDMPAALEARGAEKAVSSYYAIYRGTTPPLRRPTSGLQVERGMRREGGDRVRVMGGF